MCRIKLAGLFDIVFSECWSACRLLMLLVLLVVQLRHQAGLRQVDGARVALQHNFGIGSAAVVTVYRKPMLPSPM